MSARCLAILYACAFGWLYVLWAIFNYQAVVDTWQYLELGDGIARHATFGLPLSDGHWVPMAIRVPVFPALLGLTHLIVRDQEFTFFTLSLLQLFVAALVPCAGFYFGARLNRATAFAAYALLLLNPNLIKIGRASCRERV